LKSVAPLWYKPTMSYCNVFLGTIVARQLVPSDPFALSTLRCFSPYTTFLVVAIILWRGHCLVFRHSCTNVIPDNSCVFGRSCTKFIPNHCCSSVLSNIVYRLFPILNKGFQLWYPLFHKNGFLCSLTVITKLDPLLTKTDRCRFWIRLRHFKMAEAMGIKIVVSRSPACWISWKSTSWF
jgi:hypothetical protein